MNTPTEAGWLRRIRTIVEQRAQLERDLVQAIEAARKAGRTWGEIGIAMGLGSRAGAHQWYRRAKAKEGGPRS